MDEDNITETGSDLELSEKERDQNANKLLEDVKR